MTRERLRPWLIAALLIALVIMGGGCATTGTITLPQPPPVRY